VSFRQAIGLKYKAALETNPQRRETMLKDAQNLEARAKRQASGVGTSSTRGAAIKWGTWIKELLDDRLALQASQADNATNQRAEVATANGNGVRSSTAQTPMPPYGTPEFQRWLTDGFSA
jgi:hypothetical protein